MTEAQERIYKVLTDFVRLCEREGLAYRITGGTLLGAVRHQGFIPWDDDIDVEMPLEDYRRLMAMGDRLPDGYVLHNRATDPDYPLIMTKFCDSTRPLDLSASRGPMGEHIDIFPLIPAKPLRFSTKAAFSLVRELEYALRAVCGWREYIPNGRVARIIYRILIKLPKGLLRKLQMLTARYIYNENGPMLCSIGGTYHAQREFSPKQWYADVVVMRFEELSCTACSGWHEWLTGHYGDYMTLPEESRRVSHHTDS